jgi:hypothetical protein
MANPAPVPEWQAPTPDVQGRVGSAQAAAGPDLGEALSLIGERFVVAAAGDALILIDAVAASAALALARLMAGWQEGGVRSVPLLLPHPVPAAPGDPERLTRHADLLKRVGLDAAVIGPAAIALRGVPEVLRSVPAARIGAALGKLLDIWDQGLEANEDPAGGVQYLARETAGPPPTQHLDAWLHGLEREPEVVREGEGRWWRRLPPGALARLVCGTA